ncbi:hypothetical protein POM88_053377 [Heracleum sosnowskyi]|uniref:Uncharacterized protein n=1 Tax=Heracleum sosnowskyi TaxID=360622 RepID=A0AAD8GQU4_9APIA|nr:hypothetical protein POM88_053377 [Heracleum sosnowskyi]
MLENPLRIKFISEEIHVGSFHRLKTSALKDLLYLVIGSIHPLEQLCSFEIEGILQRRKGEDSKLDKSRRKTLNAYPERRFKLVEGKLKFRIYAFGQELWIDLQDARVCLSKVVQKYIDEMEDDAISPDEKALVEGLKEILKEALNREDEARQKRKSEANNIGGSPQTASLPQPDSKLGTPDSIYCGDFLLSPKRHILVTTSLGFRILS